MRDLRDFVGLKKIKAEVEKLIDINKTNYNREMAGGKILMLKKNRLFWGNPG